MTRIRAEQPKNTPPGRDYTATYEADPFYRDLATARCRALCAALIAIGFNEMTPGDYTLREFVSPPGALGDARGRPYKVLVYYHGGIGVLSADGLGETELAEKLLRSPEFAAAPPFETLTLNR